VVYLDFAATSFPKPPGVIEAVTDYMIRIGASPGRGGHQLAAEAARCVFDTREALAELLGVGDARQVVFTAHATEALNLSLYGLIRDGDHVVTTSLEHNAIVRPLRYLRETRQVEVSIIPGDAAGRVDPKAMGEAVTARTRLVVVNYASNVVGTLQRVAEIREAIGPDVLLLADAAQACGAVPVDMQAEGIDLLAFTGHKSLLGPPGTGGLCVREHIAGEIIPLLRGGTGSRSESEDLPETLPDRFESGTRNAPGIAGLGAAARFLIEYGVARIRKHEMELTGKLIEGLKGIPGLKYYGPDDPAERLATVPLNIEGLAPSDIATALDKRYGILTRAGLHCAPQAHKTIGTLPGGALRLALGWCSTAGDVDAALAALNEIARETRAQA
jgi:cysteine desulfurase family protein